MRVFERRGRYSARGRFEGWLHQVALNECRMYARRKKTLDRFLRRLAKMRVAGAIPGTPPNPLDALLVQEQNARLAEDLERLTDREREAVQFRFLEGWTYREAARFMGIEESSVRSLLRNAFERLRGPGKGD